MYQLRNDGKYEFVSDHTGDVLFVADEVGVSYTYSEKDSPIKGTLIKHGPSDIVKKNHDARVALYNNKVPEIAKDLYYISGKIPVEELNKMIDITGYVGNYHENNVPHVTQKVS